MLARNLAEKVAFVVVLPFAMWAVSRDLADGSLVVDDAARYNLNGEHH